VSLIALGVREGEYAPHQQRPRTADAALARISIQCRKQRFRVDQVQLVRLVDRPLEEAPATA